MAERPYDTDPAWLQCDDVEEYYEDLDEDEDLAPSVQDGVQDGVQDDLDRDLMDVIDSRTDTGDALLDMHRREADLDTRLQSQALWGDERREYRQPY